MCPSKQTNKKMRLKNETKKNIFYAFVQTISAPMTKLNEKKK